jgi:hypothetical protein
MPVSQSTARTAATFCRRSRGQTCCWWIVVYSPGNPSAPSGSGLLGCGAEKTTGIAWPSNVIEVKSEGGQGSHSAPFPRALVEFFIKAFSDAGDVVFDPFMGSGTTAAAAYVLGRSVFGMELSPAYTDVIVRRLQALATENARLAADGRTFADIEIARKAAFATNSSAVSGV